MAVGEKRYQRLFIYLLIVSFTITSLPYPLGGPKRLWAQDEVDLDAVPEEANEAPDIPSETESTPPSEIQEPVEEAGAEPVGEEVAEPSEPAPSETQPSDVSVEAGDVSVDAAPADLSEPAPAEVIPPADDSQEAPPSETPEAPESVEASPPDVAPTESPVEPVSAPPAILLPSLFFLELKSDAVGTFETGQLNQIIQEEFNKLGEYRVIGRDELNLRIYGTFNEQLDQKLVQIEQLLTSGQEKLSSENPAGAFADLTQAKTLLQDEQIRQHINFDFSKVFLYLGSALAMTGKEDEALSAYREFMKLTPERDILPDSVPVEFVSKFEALRLEHEQAAKGVISVISEPPFANVYLDGSRRGTTPITIENLAFGDHDIRLEIEEYKSLFSKVTVDATDLKTLNVTLSQNDGPALYERYKTDTLTAEGASAKAQKSYVLGDLLKVDYVLVGDLKKQIAPPPADSDKIATSTPPQDRYTLYLYLTDSHRGVLVRSGGVLIQSDFSNAQQKISGLVRLFSQKSDVVDILKPFVQAKEKKKESVSYEVLGLVDGLVSPEEIPVQRVKKESVFGKWWFWAIVGGVVAAGTTTGVLLLTQGDEGVSGSTAAINFEFE